MAQTQTPLGKIPASVGKFIADTFNYVKPTGTGTPRLARRFNAVLTGKTHNGLPSAIGWIAKIALSIGFIAATAKIAGSWLENRFAKNDLKTYEASTEELKLRTETALLRESTAYMVENSNAKHPADTYYNPNARSDNAERIEQRRAHEELLAQAGGRNMN